MADVPLFELRGISKEFPGVKALDDVSFEIRAGEVHMLVGENGAGKSTLMKILCGAYRADRGEFFNNGGPVTIHGTGAARKFGIAVIFQDFTLVPYLDIAQNIYLGREFASRVPGFIDRRRIYAEAKRVLDGIGFDIDPREPVHSLGVAQQQMVEIAKALSQDARILVMDEPTAALSDHETEKLFAMIARLKAKGVAIIYISHRLSEVFALGDRITVLRDGRKIADLLPKETTPDQLVTLMVGRPVDTTYTRPARPAPGEVALEVKNLSGPSGFSDVNLTVRAGEIVGLCGLVGSGRTEVARAIFGADRVTAGEIRLFGEPIAELDRSRDAPRDGADSGEPQDARPRAGALGRRQHRAGGLAYDVPRWDFRAAPRAQGGARGDRQAAHRHADAATAGRHAVGRQPAEGRHRQMAQCGRQILHL